MIPVEYQGLVPYDQAFAQMQAAVMAEDFCEQLIFMQHPPVFTQGRKGDAAYLGDLGAIPLVQTDRGGQVTYHGPGQLILYPLLDLKKRRLGVKALVHLLEQSGIELLHRYRITAKRSAQNPGLYVGGKKIASLGLRIKNHRSYHGMSLNVDMDLRPFDRITPCGLSGIQMTQWVEYQPAPSLVQIFQAWSQIFIELLEKA